MNVPARHESFVMPEDSPKTIKKVDPNIPNVFTYIIDKEDHTLGNLLSHELRELNYVEFAGYRVPHPLDYHIEVKLKTHSTANSDTIMNEAIDNIISDVNSLLLSFEEQLMKI